MRRVNVLALLGLSAFASSQLIDLDYVNALADPTYTIVPDLPSQVVSYDKDAAIETAADQAIETSATTPERKTKRDLLLPRRGLQERSPCSEVPSRANTYGAVLSPAESFLADGNLAHAAESAPVPQGYQRTFSNLHASSQANGYMGYALAPSYDPGWCANRCNITSGCQAFNIYFERDPVVSPADACPDPAAAANIVCTFWGGPVSADNARNTGQWRNRFHVVIAGSNGYVLTATPTVFGYAPPSPLASRAINAPLDCNGNDAYLGMRLFNDNSPFDPDRCAAACQATSDYNAGHSEGRVPRLCKFFNTYILARNGVSQGQVCSMYTQYWDPNVYGTNDGQWDGDGNRFTIQSSYTFYNSTDVTRPICPSDIPPLQADTSVAGPFCTSYNSYIAPISTSVVSRTTTVQACGSGSTPVGVSGNSQESTPMKRDEGEGESGEIVEAVVAVWPQKDDEANPGPSAEVTIPGESLTVPGIYASATSAAMAAVGAASDEPATTPASATPSSAAAVEKRQASPTPSLFAGRNPLEISSACSRVATGTSTRTSTAVATETAYGNCAQYPTTCSSGAAPNLIAGSFSTASANIDDTYYRVVLPFAICIFDACSANVNPTTNGLIGLESAQTSAFSNSAIPAFGGAPYLHVFWDDLYIYSGQRHYMDYSVCGPAGNRTVTFDWRMGRYAAASNGPLYSFSATFYENQPSRVYLKYFSTTDQGSSATIGMEGTAAGRLRSYQYSYNQAVVTNGLGLIFDYHANYFGRAS